jgi:hypothetical protein
MDARQRVCQNLGCLFTQLTVISVPSCTLQIETVDVDPILWFLGNLCRRNVLAKLAKRASVSEYVPCCVHQLQS